MRKLDVSLLDRLNPEELSLVLLEHFGRSHGSHELMTYARADGAPLLELRLNKRRRVESLYAHDALTRAEATDLEAKVRDALASDGGVSIAQSVLFKIGRAHV